MHNTSSRRSRGAPRENETNVSKSKNRVEPVVDELKRKRNKYRSKGKRDLPMEVSSKMPVKMYAPAPVPGSRKRGRDPRFDDDCGKYQDTLFSSSYGFLNEYKNEEIGEMRKLMGKLKNKEKKETVRGLMGKYKREQEDHQRASRERQIQAEFKRAERQRVAEARRTSGRDGKDHDDHEESRPGGGRRGGRGDRSQGQGRSDGVQAFHLKKTDEKDLLLADRFLHLQKTGQLKKFMAKRRKKNASKDHRWMPK